MTVSVEQSRYSYNGDGSTTVFAVPFYFIVDSAVLVTKLDTNVTPNVETTLILGTDYNLTGAGDLAGGSLTTIGSISPLPSGEKIVIERNAQYTQGTDYEPFGRFPAETLEQNLDKLTMLVQQVKALTDRVPLFDRTTAFLNRTIEEPSTGKFIQWDANGNMINVAGTINTDNYTAPVINAVEQTIIARLGSYISVKDFGATGDGLTDDTAAIDLAEADAFTNNRVLLFPQGNYVYTGSFVSRVSIIGYGATITQGRSTATTGATDATVRLDGSDLYCMGLKTSNNYKCAGFSLNGEIDCKFIDCFATESIFAGFNAYSSKRIYFERCVSELVQYESTAIAADGFYCAGCTDVYIEKCYANDFRRIGFVSERNGATKSNNFNLLNCRANNANNCDDSASEFNAAFWFENTNSANVINFKGSNLSGNAGQTSNRVIGANFVGGGNDANGTFNFENIYLEGDVTTKIPQAVECTGTSTYANVIIKNLHLKNIASGVRSLGGLGNLKIQNLILENMTTAGGGSGGVIINGTGNNLYYLEIDNVKEINVSHGTGGATINFFTAPNNCYYTLRNCNEPTYEITHAMRGAVTEILIENVRAYFKSDIYSGLLATKCRIVNSEITRLQCSGVMDINIANSEITGQSLLLNTGDIIVDNCKFTFGAEHFEVNRTYDVLNPTTWFRDCFFEKDIATNDYAVRIQEEGTNKPSSYFFNCTWYNTGAATAGDTFLWIVRASTNVVYTDNYSDSNVTYLERVVSTDQNPASGDTKQTYH